MDESLTVLHVLGPLRPSGMERMLVSAQPHFANEGVRIVVYGLSVGSTFASAMRESGLSVLLRDGSIASLDGARRLRRVVEDYDVDVIHLHMESDYLRSVTAARWALRGRQGIVVRTVHSSFPASGLWRLSRAAQAWLGDRFVSAVVAPSPDVESNERTIGRSCRVILNWVDDRLGRVRERRQERIPLDPPSMVIVGNCSSVKRHEIALAAALQAGIHVFHIGDESAISDVESRTLSRLEDAGLLISRGPQTPDDALSRADVYCMPSRAEGFGVAFAEALVAGVPSIVSDVRGLGWARGIAGVVFVSDEDGEWLAALRAALAEGVAPRLPPSLDLCAARGASEYARVYRHGVTKPGSA